MDNSECGYVASGRAGVGAGVSCAGIAAANAKSPKRRKAARRLLRDATPKPVSEALQRELGLTNGWIRLDKVRNGGTRVGRVDHYFVSPSGHIFRSAREVASFVLGQRCQSHPWRKRRGLTLSQEETQSSGPAARQICRTSALYRSLKSNPPIASRLVLRTRPFLSGSRVPEGAHMASKSTPMDTSQEGPTSGEVLEAATARAPVPRAAKAKTGFSTTPPAARSNQNLRWEAVHDAQAMLSRAASAGPLTRARAAKLLARASAHESPTEAKI